MKKHKKTARQKGSAVAREEHIRKNGAYFNIGNKYKNGTFRSKKNSRYIRYRSSYEYKFFLDLEDNPSVIKYITEPFATSYINADGFKKTYIPDVLVLYDNGDLIIWEIKPAHATKSYNVAAKSKAIIKAIQATGKNIEFRIATEKDIFKNNKEYKEFLKRI